MNANLLRIGDHDVLVSRFSVGFVDDFGEFVDHDTIRLQC